MGIYIQLFVSNNLRLVDRGLWYCGEHAKISLLSYWGTTTLCLQKLLLRQYKYVLQIQSCCRLTAQMTEEMMCHFTKNMLAQFLSAPSCISFLHLMREGQTLKDKTHYAFPAFFL